MPFSAAEGNLYVVGSFLLFTLFATIERVKNTFTSSQDGERCRIYFRNSFTLLFSSYLACVSSALIEFCLLRREMAFSVTLFGSCVFLAGMFLRNSAIRNLGKQWSVHIDLRKIQDIVRNGPYRYIRHPYYLAVLLELLGFCLIVNSYYSIAVVLGAQIPLLFLRIHYEEKVLIRKFGRAYLWYKHKLGSLPL